MKITKAIAKKVMITCFGLLLVANTYAQPKDGLGALTTKLNSLQDGIMKILTFILGIIFVVGILHVVSAKADKSDPERFKKLMINYIIAVVFVLVALSVIGVITNMSSSTKLISDS